MRWRLLPCAACLPVACLPSLLLRPALAQDAPLPPKPPAFPIVFKTPTGLNGYEEWVLAGDLIQNNKLLDALDDEGATLTQKRKVLDDPQVQQALHLLRQGLNKPTQPPARLLDTNATAPELSALYKLATLLKLEIYARCAEGNLDSAIAALDEGLQFGQRMQGDTPGSGGWGIVSEEAVLSALYSRLDQLSEYQCRRVQRIVEDWLQAPSHATLLLQQRKIALLNRLDKTRTDPDTLIKLMEARIENPVTQGANLQNISAYARQRPSDLDAMIGRAQALIAAHYDAALANCSRPVNKRIPVPFPKDDTPEGKLLSIVSIEANEATRWYDALEAKVRLLGVHAAIHRYRWEYNRLPNSLADLHLGALNTDPYTGSTLLYKRDGAVYDLSSFGPAASGSQERSASVSAQPIRLQPAG